jgi:hypothetical protein
LLEKERSRALEPRQSSTVLVIYEHLLIQIPASATPFAGDFLHERLPQLLLQAFAGKFSVARATH